MLPRMQTKPAPGGASTGAPLTLSGSPDSLIPCIALTNFLGTAVSFGAPDGPVTITDATGASLSPATFSATLIGESAYSQSTRDKVRVCAAAARRQKPHHNFPHHPHPPALPAHSGSP